MSGILKKNSARKLTREQVMDMMKLLEEGYTQGSVAKYFGVSIGTVGRYARGECGAEWSGGGAASPAVMDGIMARVMAVQEAVLADKGQEEEAALPPTQPATRTPPPSPLDDERDAPDEDAPAGLSALQQRAAGYGMDIEKLTKTEEK